MTRDDVNKAMTKGVKRGKSKVSLKSLCKELGLDYIGGLK